MKMTAGQMYLKPLKKNNCVKKVHHPYGKAGVCFSSDKGEQHFDYWVYSFKDMFMVTISDMLFRKDFTSTFDLTDFISVYYYDSVDGVELPSGRPIASGVVSAFIPEGEQFTATYHGGVPVRGVSISIMPSYYEGRLTDCLPGGFEKIKQAFKKINQQANFPELLMIMRQLQNCHLTGVGADLYYESKVNEAIALIVANSEKESRSSLLVHHDREQLVQVERYLLDHFAKDIHLSEIAQVACMSISKLKYAFKAVYGCNISDYIGNLRIECARELLQTGVRSISEIASLLGYKNTSAFTRMFKEKMGILPKDYRKSVAGSK